jgi:endonuclease/exonuclease/phosphatase family metal-dependent hydrolase
MNMHCGYKVLALKFKYEEQVFNILTGHFTWENKPDDNAYKIERAAKVLKYLQKLNHPFILTGDFNVRANTRTVKQFEQVAVNLTEKYKIGNTLNPNLSRHKHIFPKGVDCDHILISQGIKVKTYELIDEPDLSDHYALIMEFTLDPGTEKVKP